MSDAFDQVPAAPPPGGDAPVATSAPEAPVPSEAAPEAGAPEGGDGAPTTSAARRRRRGRRGGRNRNRPRPATAGEGDDDVDALDDDDDGDDADADGPDAVTAGDGVTDDGAPGAPRAPRPRPRAPRAAAPEGDDEIERAVARAAARRARAAAVAAPSPVTDELDDLDDAIDAHDGFAAEYLDDAEPPAGAALTPYAPAHEAGADDVAAAADDGAIVADELAGDLDDDEHDDADDGDDHDGSDVDDHDAPLGVKVGPGGRVIPPPPPPARKVEAAPGDGDEDGDDEDDGGEGDGAARKRRRRRRGGRGRTRTGAGNGGAPAPPPAGRAPGGGGGGGGGGRGRQAAVVDLDEPIDLDELDEELLERRRGRTRKGRPTGRYLMAVHVSPGRATQVAVLEGRNLVEHYVARPTDDANQIFGNVYKGRVQNVLPGMEAAFVDIGTPKNGVLYRADVAFDPKEFGAERPRIERVLRNGQTVMVQVTKNPIGVKGARLTQEISLAGRFVVMIPGQAQTFGISKRLPDDERKRLRKILDEIRPADAGLIVRTAAEGCSRDELVRDLARLDRQWSEIQGLERNVKAGTLLHAEPDLAIRIIREEFNREYRQVLINDRSLYEQVRDYVASVSPELAERIELYEEDFPLFERFHVEEQLAKALDRKVWLPSGGSLVIDRTEALTVIDVNTGRNVGKSNLEETVFRNNLEAADEVARQLRLRDVGGIIVIDFIDMEIKKNREEVIRVFREALARDKTRTQVFDISELGLVEMTRKRVAEDLVDSFSHKCEHCDGRGFVFDESLLDFSTR